MYIKGDYTAVEREDNYFYIYYKGQPMFQLGNHRTQFSLKFILDMGFENMDNSTQ